MLSSSSSTERRSSSAMIGRLGPFSRRMLASLIPRFADDDFRLADAMTRKVRSSPELEAAIEHAQRSGRDARLVRRQLAEALWPHGVHD